MAEHSETVADVLNRCRSAVAALLAATPLVVSYPIASPRTSAITALCTALCAAVLWPHLGRTVRARAIVVGAAAGLALLWSREAWLSGGGIALLLAAVARSRETPLRAVSRALLFAVAATSLILLIEATGLIWQELARASWTVTAWFTGFAGPEQRLSAGHSPLPWLHFAAWFWIAQILLGRRRWGWQLRQLFVLVAAAALSLIFLQPVLAIGTIAIVALFGEWSGQERRALKTAIPAGFSLILGAIVIVVVYCNGLGNGTFASSPTIGIVEGGLKTLDLPDAEDLKKMGDDAEFGGLERLLPLYGWSVRIVPEDFAKDDIDDLTVVAVINPTSRFSDEQMTAVESYVRRGGRLLVLGDHTDIGGVMRPLNQLLGFTSIRFRFDSAIPMDAPNWKWAGCLRGAAHPAFHRIRNDALGISVGASLETGPNARVLVCGDHSFSDDGRPDYGDSRLGNMAHDIGEERGGLPLVAEERVGDGVVQVWGDTAGFQTNSLMRTGHFIASSIGDLAVRRPLPASRPAVAVTACVALLAGTMLLAPLPVHLLTAMLAGCAAMAGLSTLLFNPVGAAWHDYSSAGVLDLTHVPTHPGTALPRSLDRLGEVFVRGGTMLIGVKNLDSALADHPRFWVIVAPNRSYSEREAVQLETYVARGGGLVIMAGYEQRHAVRHVLARFDLDIDPSIFGAAHNARIGPPEWREEILAGSDPLIRAQKDDDPEGEFGTFYDADIQFQESYPILADDAEVLASCWGRPISVRKRHGMGSITLIADARFANAENLQYGTGFASTINSRNARFLLRCLDL